MAFLLKLPVELFRIDHHVVPFFLAFRLRVTGRTRWRNRIYRIGDLFPCSALILGRYIAVKPETNPEHRRRAWDRLEIWRSRRMQRPTKCTVLKLFETQTWINTRYTIYLILSRTASSDSLCHHVNAVGRYLKNNLYSNTTSIRGDLCILSIKLLLTINKLFRC